jgi:uncharacterized cupredoxin-like copper-binding protein
VKYKKILLASLALIATTFVYAEGDLSRANVQTVMMEMGTKDGKMYFKPNHLNFKTGHAYKIVLKNVDKIKHEVEANEFVDKIFTRKVEVKDKNGGLVAEIKGAIREIEVGPMSEVEWYVVPIQPGKNIERVCAIAGHKEAGMHGLITIE